MTLEDGELGQIVTTENSSPKNQGYIPPNSVIIEVEDKIVKLPHMHDKQKRQILKNLCNLMRKTGLEAPGAEK